MAPFSTFVTIEDLLLSIDIEMAWSAAIEGALVKGIFPILEFESPSLKR